MLIRPFQSQDLSALHGINVAGEPGVGPVTKDQLAEIIADGLCLVAVDALQEPVGFVLLVAPGTSYQSPNYKWFESRYGPQPDAFVYVDRIAIAASAQGSGLGAQLYNAAFQTCAGRWPRICCEVNTEPPNPGSVRFHKRLNFVEVGTQIFSPGEKAVVYLERAL